MIIQFTLYLLRQPILQQLQELRAQSLGGEQVLASKGQWVVKFRFKEDVCLGLRDESRCAEEFAPPIEGEGHIDVPKYLAARFRVEDHIVELGGQHNSIVHCVTTSISKGSISRDQLNTAIAHSFPFVVQIPALFLVVVICSLDAWFSLRGGNGVILIELGRKVVVRSEVCKVIAIDLLSSVYTLAYDEHDIDHELRPRCYVMVTIDEDILE